MVKRHLFTGVIAVATLAAFSMSDADATSLKSANTKQNTSVTKADSTNGSHTKKVYTAYKSHKNNKKVRNNVTQPNGPTQVPEPATMALLGSVLGGLAFARRLRKKPE